MKPITDPTASAASRFWVAGLAQGAWRNAAPASASPRRTWVLVLAGGDGTANPRQYCAFNGGESLLAKTIRCSLRLASPARTMTVVAAEHRCWWRTAIPWLMPHNIVAEPRNRGTATGILLPLLEILDRDPEADVVVLPADHYITDEAILHQSIRRALLGLRNSPDGVILLGVVPNELDPDRGYMLPSRSAEGGTLRVRRFVERPQPSVARRLIAAGALWNTSVIVARASCLLELFVARCAVITRILMDALQDSRVDGGLSLDTVYRVMPSIDFSAQVLAGAESSLRVVRAPHFGWIDLGAPERLATHFSCMESDRLRSRGVRSGAAGSRSSELHRCGTRAGRTAQGPTTVAGIPLQGRSAVHLLRCETR